MNTVYFLGAGASKNFGYPLTSEIMPEILHKLIKNILFNLSENDALEEQKAAARLLSSIYKLYPGLKEIDAEKEVHRIPNITEVLSLIDHCSFYNIPPHPDLSEDKLEDFRQLLNRAIGEVLFKYENENYTAEQRKLLDSFLSVIKQKSKKEQVTFITTNYDLVLEKEFILHMFSNQVDFGIFYRSVSDSKLISPAANSFIKLYKLHGSLNWLRCSMCGHYYINQLGSIVHEAFKQESGYGNTCICSNSLRLKSVLVSPSLVRDIRDSNLLQIWKAALEAIRTADKLVFFGYSLPAEDLAIKSIIMRGINGRRSSQDLKIEVIQKGFDAQNNYLNLFGNTLKYYEDELPGYLLKNNAHN